MKKRVIDYRGDAISYPSGYEKSLNSITEMIDSMHQDNVDISDMYVILAKLNAEVQFHMIFHLPIESKNHDQQNQTNSNKDQTSTQENGTTPNS